MDSSYKRRGPPRLEESLRLLEEAKRLIPCATQTLSKGYTQWSVGASPLFLRSAKGCEVTDVDGNTYIDYGMGLGPFILGYGDPDVDTAIQAQLKDGTMFTLPHPLEIEVAKLITEVIPCAEMVRFGKNGSDATTGAVKLARAYTGKEKIITCGYHGWHDWFIATTERDKGVAAFNKKLSFPAQYNDIASFEKIIADNKGDIAAIIMEPVYVIEPKPGFLEAVRALATKEKIVLIYDELFCGFRWALGGASEFFKVTPDLATFGKAMANGMPIAAVTGRRDIMEEFEEVFFSFTYAGEALSLAATVASIGKLRREPVYEHIWKIGTMLKDGVHELIAKHKLEESMSILGYPQKTAISFSETNGIKPLEIKTFVQQECAARGILFIGYHLPSFAHTEEHATYTLEVYDEVFALVADALNTGDLKKRLRGSVLEQIFKNVGDRSTGIAKKKPA